MTCVSVSCSLVIYQQGTRESLIEREWPFVHLIVMEWPFVDVEKWPDASRGPVKRKSILVPAFFAWLKCTKPAFLKPCQCIQSPSTRIRDGRRAECLRAFIQVTDPGSLFQFHTAPSLPSVLPKSGLSKVLVNLRRLRPRSMHIFADKVFDQNGGNPWKLF